jgi:hypothetical protein
MSETFLLVIYLVNIVGGVGTLVWVLMGDGKFSKHEQYTTRFKERSRSL